MPVLTLVQASSIPVALEADILLFNDLLEGWTRENTYVPTDSTQEEKVVRNEEATEEPEPLEMDEVLFQEMQKLIRMPIQQPPQPEVVTVPLSFEREAKPTQERGQVSEALEMVNPAEIKTSLPLAEKSVQQPLPKLEQMEYELVNQVDEVQQAKAHRVPTEEKLPGVERPQIVESIPDERAGFTSVTPPKPSIISVPFETIKATLVWQEPAQAVQKLGEIITMTLDKSPEPTAKVIQITLAPEQFGEMEIQLTFQEERIEAVIFVQKDEIKNQLREHLDYIREYLPQNPIVHKITIDMAPMQLPFQIHAQQHFQSRKHSQSHAKNDSRGTLNHEEEQQNRSINEERGFSLYV